MAWYPLGPAHVHQPRNPSYARISRQNEYGSQGTVVSITFQPANRDRILVVDRPDSGGRGLWLTTDGAATWSPVLDAVHAAAGAAYGPGVDPTCAVFHPNVASYAYVGSGRKRSLYRSTDGGVTWTVVHEFAGAIRSITVNPRTGADLAAVGGTQLFVVVAEPGAPPAVNGIWFSANEGGSWTQVLAGDVDSFAPRFPPAPAAADAYAFVRYAGLYYSSDPGVAATYALVPTGPALAPGGSGPLPGWTSSEGNYDRLRLTRSAADGERVWAWAAFSDSTRAIFRRGTGGVWTRIATSGTLPIPWQGARNFVFAAAPVVPAGASSEPLFFGGVWLYRSTDGGMTWHEADPAHPDVHAIAFRPPATAGGLPELWVGHDGGVACSTGYAGAAAIPSMPNRNEGAAVDTTSPAIRPMNRGKAGSAAYQFAVPPGARTLTYLGCQDTGIAVGGGSATWRSAMGADAGSLAAAPGPAGMRVWAVGGFNPIPWPAFDMRLFVDSGALTTGSSVTRAGTGGLVPTTSNYVLHGTDACLAGAISRDAIRHIAAAVDPSSSPVWITLDSVAGIQPGQWVTINPAVEQMETQRVVAIDTAGIRIQVHFLIRHYDPLMAMALNDAVVVRANSAGVATVISGSLASGAHIIRAVALQPGSAGVALAATRRTWYLQGMMDATTNYDDFVPPDPEFDRPRVYKTTGGVASLTTWALVDGNRPTAAGGVSSVAVAGAGQGFALLQEPVAGTAAGGGTVTTPLFRIDGLNWVALPPAALPTGFPFGKVLVDPLDDGRLFVSCGGHVYTVSAGTGGTWAWSPISTGSDGLPGDAITDMWIGNVGTAGAPKVLLRVATAARGVWETDVTPGAAAAAVQLYLRDNVLDDGWIVPSPFGTPNPLRPAENVWWWQSPDIRVETSQGGPGSSFYQTQPEWAGGRLPHTMFNLVRDFSLNLEQNRAAKIHVQVHNRSRLPASARVVVLATRAAAGVPNLDLRSDGTTFPFWSRFHADGTVDLAGWPANSVWTPVEMTAEMVAGIHASEPQVVSRTWTVPPLSEGDHRCLIAIVHSAANSAAAVTSSTHVDSITRIHRGFGQKNLHIVAMQLSDMGQRPDIEGARQASIAGRAAGRAWLSAPFDVDFWAPEDRIADLVFDLRGASGLTLRIELADAAPIAGDHPGAPSGGGIIGWFGRGLIAAGRLLVKIGGSLIGAPAKAPVDSRPRCPVMQARAGTAVVIGGVRIDKGRPLTARLTIEGDETLVDGEEHRFDIVQRSNGEAVGGCSYLVRVGKPRAEGRAPESAEPEKATRLTRLAPLILAPPWMEDEVVWRLRERGRMPGS